MRKTLVAAIAVVAMSSVLALGAVAAPVDADAVVSDLATVQAYSMEPIPDADLLAIVSAGVNAPSHKNTQQWHFTVVSNPEVLAQMKADRWAEMSPEKREKSKGVKKAAIGDSPAAIFISSSTGNVERIFESGLAGALMAAKAGLLGYSTKIWSVPGFIEKGDKSANYIAKLGVPEGQQLIAILLVGRIEEGYDVVSTATPRKPIDEIVTFIK